MDLRDIVVLLDASPASEERLRLAARVARDHVAHLSAVFVQHDQAIDFSPAIAGRSGLVNQLVQTVAGTRRSAVANGSFELRLRDSLHWFGGDSTWHEVDAAGSARLIACTRSADLVIRCRMRVSGLAGALCRDLQRDRPPCSGCLGWIARGSSSAQRCAAVDRQRDRRHRDNGTLS